MERDDLSKAVLVHLPSMNPKYGLTIARVASAAERAFFMQGKVPSNWPHQNWLKSVVKLVPQIEQRLLAQEGFYSTAPELLEKNIELNDEQPVQLYYEGDYIAGPYIAVIGPRLMSEYAAQITTRWVRSVAERRVILSGLAYGIDMLALRSAVAAGGKVVVVVPFGLRSIYPTGHLAELKKWVIDGQAMVVSEYLWVERRSKPYFLWRNRLMASLSDSLFVPEAARQSGTRVTVDYAIELAKKIAVIPADITRESAVYTNQLVRDGATILLNQTDWYHFCGMTKKDSMVPLKYLTLVACLQAGYFEPEAILANLKVSPSALSILLHQAEEDGIITREPDGRVRLLSDYK